LRLIVVIVPLLGLLVTFAAFLFMALFVVAGWPGGPFALQVIITGSLLALSAMNAWLLINWRRISMASRQFLVPLVLSVLSTVGIVFVVLRTLVVSHLL
jgi:hypothetical protein